MFRSNKSRANGNGKSNSSSGTTSASSYLFQPSAEALMSIATQPINFAKHALGYAGLTHSPQDLGSLQTPVEQGLFPSTMEYRDPGETSDGEEDYEEQKKIDPETKLKIYSLAEVSLHDTFDDAWIVLYDKVCFSLI